MNSTRATGSHPCSRRFQRVPNSPKWSPKMMPTWLCRQDFAKFSLKRHYNVSTVNKAENQSQNFPASIPKVSSVNNVKQEPSSSTQTSESTVLTVNNVEEQKQNSVASIPKASTSNNSDEELACDPKSNCEQKVPPDLDFQLFDEYMMDPEEICSQFEDETLSHDSSTGCPSEDFRFYGYICPEVWNSTKFWGDVGAKDDIEFPITFENRLLDVPLFVLNVWLDRLEAHMNG
ncbi:hypothetical protein TNCV_1498361 [Trichonephila clavipes]|nr:hypothetical protein TNCV_1498361 [Trichonephila clavipes]